ncbi:serine hydrolase FSH [Aspergillus oleicola]
MRFLCLHGRGTNSNIFEVQLAALRSRLSSQHSFDFIDAEYDCRAAPGIREFYSSPYLCWYERGSPEEVRSAHRYLVSVIEEDGPYDGVVGFSEGAALAASVLLSSESSSSQPHFKIAILFNSVVPFVPCEQMGQPLSDVVEGHKDSYLDILLANAAEATAQEQMMWLSQVHCFSPKEQFKISIPTIHVIGARDSFKESSQGVVDLCRSNLAQVLFHEGGHELPQDDSTLDRCAELIETVAIIAVV